MSTSKPGSRESDRTGLAFRRHAVHRRPPWKGQVQQVGYFIKRFARGVVAGSSERFVIPITFKENEFGMASGNDQSEKGWFEFRMFDQSREEMAFQVIHPDHRNATDPTQRPGRHDTNQ